MKCSSETIAMKTFRYKHII